MKTLLAVLTFASIAQASTYECVFDKGATPFKVVEHFPLIGQATFYSSASKPLVLPFTETVKQRNTRVGVITYTTKTYTHPYYEYKIYDYDHEFKNTKTCTGTYTAEMNKAVSFTCERAN